MMTVIDQSLIEIFAAYSVGALDARQLRARVISLLTEDCDDQVFAVAVCDEQDTNCIATAASQLFASRGFSKINWPNVLKIYAIAVSKMIIGGEVADGYGAELIARASRVRDLPHGFHDLDTFRYAASELPDRPEDRQLFEKAIREEAENWASKNSLDYL